jgi:hypothetical protein
MSKSHFYIKAQAPSTGGGWTRPTEWLPLPDFAPTDNKISILNAVYENMYNVLSFAGGATFSTIYWGDGTSNVSNGGYQNKIYDYVSLSGSVNVDEFGRNYKQVLIDVVSTSGQTLVRLGRNFTQTTGWLDFKAQSTSLTTLDVLFNQQAPYLKQVDISGLTQNAVHSGLLQFNKAKNIENFIFNPSLTGAIGSTWFGNNGAIAEYGDFSSNTSTVATLFFNSSIKKVGNISVPNALANNMFDACKSLTQIGNLNMPSCTNAIQMFRNSYLLTKIGTLTLSPSITTISEMFLASNVQEVVFTNTLANVTAVANFLGGATNVKRLVTPGLTRGINVINAQMSATALNEFFTSLGTAFGPQTITATGNPGSATCNTSIATSKGYTVVI